MLSGGVAQRCQDLGGVLPGNAAGVADLSGSFRQVEGDARLPDLGSGNSRSLQLHDHATGQGLRVRQGFLKVVDLADRDVGVAQCFEPFVAGLREEDGLESAGDFLALLLAGGLVRDEVLATDGAAKVLPEPGLDGGYGEVPVIGGAIDVVVGRSAVQASLAPRVGV